MENHVEHLLRIIRHDLIEEGWTVKAAWIDRKAGGELAGIRLTNAEAILEEAKSIQIFDTETVTIQTGFNQDQREAFTFTKDDAAQFLNYLREETNILPDELWEIIPEPPQEPATAAPQSPVTDVAKSDLVNFLATQHPHIFGKYGSQPATGADFYTTLRNYLDDPDRAGRESLRVLHTLEVLAHGFYGDANQHLRRGELERAAGSVYAAEALRDIARHRRQAMAGAPDLPPEQEYPEAIIVADHGTPGEPHTLTAADFISAGPEEITRPEDTHIVVVRKPDDPRDGQMGEVQTIQRAMQGDPTLKPGDEFSPNVVITSVLVKFKDGQQTVYQPSELQWLTGQKQGN